MRICPECNHEEYPGVLYCSNCGASLVELGGKQAVLEKAPEPRPPSLVGQSHETMADKSQIIFIIPVSGRQLTFTMGTKIVIGRDNPESDFHPNLNLVPDGGADLGVSRYHALISLDEQSKGLVLIDQKSTNGTKLNDYPIPPELPYPIKSGDEIQFGNLLVHVFVK